MVADMSNRAGGLRCWPDAGVLQFAAAQAAQQSRYRRERGDVGSLPRMQLTHSPAERLDVEYGSLPRTNTFAVVPATQRRLRSHINMS